MYNKILLQLSNLQIIFFTSFHFSLLQEWELRETILTMTNHNLHQSN